MSIERALELAEAAAGRGYPNPTVGAVVVSGDGATSARESPSRPAGGMGRSSRSTPRVTLHAGRRST